MIKAIAFDYGGVIKINEKDPISEIVDYLKISKEDWRKEYFSLNYLFNTNQKSYNEMILQVISKFTDKEEDKNYILNILNTNYNDSKLNTGLIEIIKSLKLQKFKIALLSNNSIDLRNILSSDGIIQLFDEIIISAEVGFQKPQPEIFKILFSKLNLNANEVMFVDDTPKSLEGARDIGYVPVLYTNNEELKLNLSSILKINF